MDDAMDDAVDDVHLDRAEELLGCDRRAPSDARARAVAEALARCGVPPAELYAPRPPADLAAAAERAAAAAAVAADDVYRLMADGGGLVSVADVGAPADPVLFRAPTVVPAGWAPRRSAVSDSEYVAAFAAATARMVPLPLRAGGCAVWATGTLVAGIAAGDDFDDDSGVDPSHITLQIVDGGALQGDEAFFKAVEEVVCAVVSAMADRRTPEGRGYNLSVGLRPGVVEVMAATHRSEAAETLTVRVSLAAYRDVDALLAEFGQPAARVAFDGRRAVTTRLGAYALARRCNVVVFDGGGNAGYGLPVAHYSRRGYATVLPHLRADALKRAARGGAPAERRLAFCELVVAVAPDAEGRPPAAATGPGVVCGRLTVDWDAVIQPGLAAVAGLDGGVPWQEYYRPVSFGHFESHTEDNIYALLDGGGQFKYSVYGNVKSDMLTQVRRVFALLAKRRLSVGAVINRESLITRLAEKLSDVDRATGYRAGVGAAMKAAALQMAVDAVARYSADDDIAWRDPPPAAPPRDAAVWYGAHYDAAPRPAALGGGRADPPPAACFNAECPICMNAVAPGAPNVVVLACRHAVHWADVGGGCGGLNAWCQSGKKICPLCRTGFAPPPGSPPRRGGDTYDLVMDLPRGRPTHAFVDEIEAAYRSLLLPGGPGGPSGPSGPSGPGGPGGPGA